LRLNQDDIQRIRQKDERYIMELYKQTFPLMMSVAVRFEKNREEQFTAVHNAFLKMLRFIDQFKVNSSFEAWLLRIVRNELIDTYRRQHKLSNIEFTELKNEIPEPEFQLEQLENTAPSQVLAILNDLPPASKLVFNLFAIDDYSINQISEELGISRETVKWHLKTSRKILRANLANLKNHEHEIE
jgi:RNA polymerase sigma factor (sigma-70 family)